MESFFKIIFKEHSGIIRTVNKTFSTGISKKDIQRKLSTEYKTDLQVISVLHLSLK